MAPQNAGVAVQRQRPRSKSLTPQLCRRQLPYAFTKSFEKTASVAGMQRKLPRNFLQSKTQWVRNPASGLVRSGLAGQLLERLIVLEPRNVVDRRSRDVQ